MYLQISTNSTIYSSSFTAIFKVGMNWICFSCWRTNNSARVQWPALDIRPSLARYEEMLVNFGFFSFAHVQIRSDIRFIPKYRNRRMNMKLTSISLSVSGMSQQSPTSSASLVVVTLLSEMGRWSDRGC